VACRFCGQDFRVGTRRSSNQCPLRPNHQHEPNTVLLDNDWDYKLRLARPQARALVTTIIVDTEWLRDQGIMDYSLLLGIHRSRYNLMSLGGGGLAPSRSQAEISGGGAAAAVTAPAAPHVANGAPITIRSPTLPVPRRPASLKSEAAANRLEGLPSSLGSPLCVQSSLVSATQSSFSSLALSADSGGGGGGGGGGTPRSVECPGTATSLFSPLPLESVLSDELDSGAGPLFVEVGEAPRGGGAAAAPHAPSSLFHEHRGGMRAVVVEGPGVYYLGIVDVLQRWTFSKRFENWFKSRVRLYDASGLSAVPPWLYASRFKTRVLAQLIEGWDEERGRSGSVGNV
jgi:1-phosphatidylinositol-4-phosphate 5-kinase